MCEDPAREFLKGRPATVVTFRFKSEVQVGHDAVAGWFAPGTPLPAVTVTA
jgi:hypothetical protein